MGFHVFQVRNAIRATDPVHAKSLFGATLGLAMHSVGLSFQLVTGELAPKNLAILCPNSCTPCYVLMTRELAPKNLATLCPNSCFPCYTRSGFWGAGPQESRDIFYFVDPHTSKWRIEQVITAARYSKQGCGNPVWACDNKIAPSCPAQDARSSGGHCVKVDLTFPPASCYLSIYCECSSSTWSFFVLSTGNNASRMQIWFVETCLVLLWEEAFLIRRTLVIVSGALSS